MHRRLFRMSIRILARRRHTHALVVFAGCSLVTAGLLVAGCSSPQQATPAAPPPSTQPLWGDMKSVVSVKELMRDLLDPLADNIFDAVGEEWSHDRRVERSPKTDADWDKIRMGAVAMAEGAYLLKVPRPFAPAGDNNNSTGPEPMELSPAQIAAKREKDPVLWDAKIEALRNVGLQVLEIVKRKDVTELWDAAENLDEACENCHLEYWYPGQKRCSRSSIGSSMTCTKSGSQTGRGQQPRRLPDRLATYRPTAQSRQAGRTRRLGSPLTDRAARRLQQRRTGVEIALEGENDGHGHVPEDRRPQRRVCRQHP